MGHDVLVRALSFDPRTGRLVSASYDRSVKLSTSASSLVLVSRMMYGVFDWLRVEEFTGLEDCYSLSDVIVI